MTPSFDPIMTRRLLLRRLVPADAAAVFSYRSDPAVSQYQNWVPGSEEDARTFLAELEQVQPDTPGTWLQLAITRRDGPLIGDCGLRFPADDKHQGEVGISLSPEHHGQGLATEALSAVLDYLFGPLAKHRVFASVDPRNTASIRLLERIGMRQEAHLRQSILIRGEWVDDLIFALLRAEWSARQPTG